MTAFSAGTLCGIGVGPGDPDLLTLKAVNALHRADVILAAASPRNEHSVALSIASPHLRPEVEVLRLDFPMTRDKAILQAAWDKNAALTVDQLRQGHYAVFLTLGDPLIYSTFGYLMRHVLSLLPEANIEIVPGITSFQAAAARTRTILCESHETLRILPGILENDDLRPQLDHNDSAVILKAYRRFDGIRQCLNDQQRDAIFVSRLGLDGEDIQHDLSAVASPPYLSLILSPPKRKK